MTACGIYLGNCTSRLSPVLSAKPRQSNRGLTEAESSSAWLSGREPYKPKEATAVESCTEHHRRQAGQCWAQTSMFLVTHKEAGGGKGIFLALLGSEPQKGIARCCHRPSAAQLSCHGGKGAGWERVGSCYSCTDPLGPGTTWDGVSCLPSLFQA